jgi:hypothetical protein
MFDFRRKKYNTVEDATVAEALLQNKLPLGNYSFRLHSWRNEPHMLKETPSAWVTVNGVPNLNAFRIKLRDGMHIEPQSKRRLSFLIARHSRAGFYYRHFYYINSIRHFFLNFIRKINDYGGNAASIPEDAGISELDFKSSEVLRPRTFVIGAGRAGIGVLSALEDEDVLVADVLPEEIIKRRIEAMSLEDFQSNNLFHGSRKLLADTTVFAAEGEHLFAAVCGYNKIYFIKPERTFLCTGAEDIKPLFPGNGIPGVISGQTLIRYPFLAKGASYPLLYLENSIPLSTLKMLSDAVHFSTVVVRRADDKYISEVREMLNAEVLRGNVSSAFGARHVETVKIQSEGKSSYMRCDLLVISGRKQPRIELASLLKLKMSYSTHYSMPVLQTDGRYRCSETIHACGSLLSPSPDALLQGIAAAEGREEEHSESMEKVETGSGMICFCMDVDAEDIEYMAENGYSTLNRMKRFSGLFMGPCQGARCFRNAFEKFEECTGKEIDMPTIRPPVVPVFIGALALADLEEVSGGKEH